MRKLRRVNERTILGKKYDVLFISEDKRYYSLMDTPLCRSIPNYEKIYIKLKLVGTKYQVLNFKRPKTIIILDLFSTVL